ncbi:hypothetical protein FB45DRAFT_869695 [Roridomyces roridus]|uniref:Uncharacterized protein n=1 Tax=Roridomyces roridus TaxID=1738132 RepID=A0AAD7BLU7_9AGAR|nr:hypothetical protein FB45DRAFT_869695 [Roridomyces roridus]
MGYTGTTVKCREIWKPEVFRQLGSRDSRDRKYSSKTEGSAFILQQTEERWRRVAGPSRNIWWSKQSAVRGCPAFFGKMDKQAAAVDARIRTPAQDVATGRRHAVACPFYSAKLKVCQPARRRLRPAVIVSVCPRSTGLKSRSRPDWMKKWTNRKRPKAIFQTPLAFPRCPSLLLLTTSPPSQWPHQAPAYPFLPADPPSFWMPSTFSEGYRMALGTVPARRYIFLASGIFPVTDSFEADPVSRWFYTLGIDARYCFSAVSVP